MGDVDMLGKATAAVAARMNGMDTTSPQALARAALEAAGVIGPGAQPPPVHQDGEPSVHDEVVQCLLRATWSPGLERAIGRIEARKEFGFAKYGTALQIGGPRDPREDAADEVADGVAYTQQGLERAKRDDTGAVSDRVSWWRQRRDRLADELIILEEGPPDG